MGKKFFQKNPNSKLARTIKNFWQVDSEENRSIVREKIIPDGYPEIIFHYGDHYKTNINGVWQNQGLDLIAGQIKNHFFLENSGVSKMFGIKLQPWVLAELFDIDMFELTDKVIEVPDKILKTLQPVKKICTSSLSFDEKVTRTENWFSEFIAKLNFEATKGQEAVELIINNNGKVELKSIQDKIGISDKSLERYFKKNIGLSPKYYSRVIRFAYIFKLINSDEIDWSDIAFLTGFYDQSHFIKNFKEFTGEDPSKYAFFEKNLANFFLKR